MLATLDFSTNLNFLGVPPGLINAATRDLERSIVELPDYRNVAARAAIAQRYAVDAENVCIETGTTALIYGIARLTTGSTLVQAPTFWAYEQAARRSGRGSVIEVMAVGISEAMAALEDGLAANEPDTVFICNPNNPTTAKLDRGRLESLITSHPRTLFVIDETYLLFEDDYWSQTLVQTAARRDNVLVITSLSKFFHVAGARIGFAVGSRQLILQLNSRVTPYAFSSLAQFLVEWIFGNCEDFCEASRAAYMQAHRQAISLIESKLGNRVDVVGTTAKAFLLLQWRDASTKTDHINSILQPEGIRTRSGSEFTALGNRYMRISVKSGEATQLLVSRLERVLSEE